MMILNCGRCKEIRAHSYQREGAYRLPAVGQFR
jgi:hypothetical protein